MNCGVGKKIGPIKEKGLQKSSMVKKDADWKSAELFDILNRMV